MRFKQLFFLALLLLLLTNVHTLFAQELKIIEYDGLSRSYTVNLPSNYGEQTSAPLIIALHGAGSDGLNFQLGIQLDEIADELGFIAVFPDGYQLGWNYLDEDEMAQGEDWTDDVGFLSALIDQLIEDYHVNTRRIFIMGFSNGALLALRMGCELDNRLAGVAAIAATYSFELAVHCADAAAIPGVLVWGTEDDVFPTQGFIWAAPDGKIRSSFSLNQTRSYFLTRNQCPTAASPIQVHTENSAYPVQREIYIGCGSGVPTLFYLLVGEGHNWPDGVEITLLDNQTPAPIEMSFFEVFNHIQRPPSDH
jgi:polyhydroxybutyrate depolymerase